MDKCVQMLEKNYGTLVTIVTLRTNRTREAERDFWGLPMRMDEGRVVDPPLVFKKGFFLQETRRVRDGENLRSALKEGGPRLEWK
ncbi:hypothetical protein TNCV_5062351 [Trichonephila clavipes]|nr:hypothetical protein TNCV_5062351 [Trichonephila clavipes]